MAKAIGAEMRRPVLICDPGMLKDKHVGESEQKVRRFIQIAEAMAPCVVLIDEIEKALAGATGKHQGDSGVSADQLIEERGGVKCGTTQLTWADILEKYFQMEGCSILGRAYLRQAGDLKLIPAFWEIGVVGLDIALDEDTGKISVDSLVTIGDVGLAIHPAMTEGQDMGAVTMGLGLTIFARLKPRFYEHI